MSNECDEYQYCNAYAMLKDHEKDRVIQELGKALEHIYCRFHEIEAIRPSIIQPDDIGPVANAIVIFREHSKGASENE